MKIEDPEVFTLTTGDRNSAVWQKLLKHLNEKLRCARLKNDGPRDAVETATLRGQIGVLKTLIELDTDKRT